ncbi:MAG: hypothetical protein AAF619_10260 [Pseudomonadota bacterium]
MAMLLSSASLGADFDLEPIVGEAAVGKAKVMLEVAATYFDQEVKNGFGASINTAGFDFIRQPDSGIDIENWGLTGALEAWAPVNVPTIGEVFLIGRVEAAFVEDDLSSTVTLEAGEFFDTLPIDGAVSPGAITSGAGTTLNLDVDVDYRRFGGFAGVGREIPGADVKIGLGVYAAISQLDLSSEFQDDGVPTNFIRLDETVDTFTIGPMLVGEANVDINQYLGAFVSGRAAVVYAHGDLDADQEASNLAVDISVDDTDSGAAVILGIKTGLTVSPTEQLSLSLFGGLDWRNDVYEIVNPRSGPGLTANDAASYAPEAAHIDQIGQFAASVGVRAELRF